MCFLLNLTDRNMQVRISLKVVLKFLDSVELQPVFKKCLLVKESILEFTYKYETPCVSWGSA